MKKLENPKFYIEEMIRLNLSNQEAAEKFNLNRSTIRRYCKEFNHVPLRKKKYTDDMLTHLYDRVINEGCTQTSVCNGDVQLEKALSRFIKKRKFK